MTREEIINGLYDIKNWECNGNSKMYEVIINAIKALEQEPCDDATLKDIFCMGCEYKEQEPKWDRLYSWLNDMRLGIAPDETITDIDERNVRIAQTDILDEIMEWMLKQEPQKSEDKE